MRRINIEDLEAQMQVGRNIYNSEGRVLLSAGAILTESYIARLRELGIPSLYIREDNLPDVLEPPELISEQTRIETTKIVKDSFKQMETEHKINIRLVQTVVNNLIDELLSNQHLLLNMTDIRSYDDYTFGHSVNVCVLSIMTGITMRYHDSRLKELAIGALLHDIGKTKISKDILNKDDDLTREEYNEVKKHTEYGFDMLRRQDELSLFSAHIALQHHERWDGKGYPRGLAREDIHEYARIVAVADVYDALLADRPYRSAYTVNQALTIMKRMSGIQLDPRCLTALIANIAVYPIGSLVELNNGSIGIVVDVNKEAPTRPVVKIIFDPISRRIYHSHEIDLSKLSTIIIIRSLSEEDFAELVAR
ncbi:HD domain [Syntrophomonas zehnderi OL-4]|uniref:HD domain n=1 Tax=Syntrophomonas zehnderi OL-4 TaxID=690567 RepID=A0A0E3W3J1_9FIRM|nr:HD-GYP domain-containing protein [Syntrophomonas zehnderi]CFX86134.1 HD domain [Syntrophomonas zehnderi OL-4]